MRKTPYKPTWRDCYESGTIYIKPPHKYGFKIKIGHPEIRPFYEKFKSEMNIPVWCPLSNDERFGFERLVLCGYYPEIKLKRA